MTVPPGILLLDKPSGPTSHDAVARVRRAVGIRRVGHAGTLDPFASGLLLLLLESATRLSEYLSDLDKVYEATARLGLETTTLDPEGDAVGAEDDWARLTSRQVEEALSRLRGRQLQEPPAFSAKKIRGQAAHRRARRGESVSLEPVAVTVHEISLLEISLPEVGFRVRCSSGTYVRALARDLGRSLGVGAHLRALRRTRIGSFRLEDALGWGASEDRDRILAHLISPGDALAHLPAVEVRKEEGALLRKGQFIPLEGGGLPEEAPVRVLEDGELLAVGSVRGKLLRPRKVFHRD